MDNNLNKKWENFDTEKFVEGVFGNVDENVNQEAKELMEETKKTRNKTDSWAK